MASCTRVGHTHSIEVWHENVLVGGLYGISLGGFFAGESMFHRERDASKVALATLIAHLRCVGFACLTSNKPRHHAVRMGATEIRRSRFVTRLREALEVPVTFGHELDLSQLHVLIGRES